MNLPSAFLTRMQEMLGEEYEAFLQSYESGHYQSLRLNPRKTDREEFMEKSPFHLTPVAWEKNGFYYRCQYRTGTGICNSACHSRS